LKVNIDPAIVAFYDKCIYKKLRLKELSLSDPLYHGKKQYGIWQNKQLCHDTPPTPWKFLKIIWPKMIWIWAIHFYTPVKIRAQYGIPLFVRPSVHASYDNISHLFPLLLIGHVVTYIVQNFHQFKAFVGLSDCRTIGLSNYSYGPLQIGLTMINIHLWCKSIV
jgi:hypothetical protein